MNLLHIILIANLFALSLFSADESNAFISCADVNTSDVTKVIDINSTNPCYTLTGEVDENGALPNGPKDVFVFKITEDTNVSYTISNTANNRLDYSINGTCGSSATTVYDDIGDGATSISATVIYTGATVASPQYIPFYIESIENNQDTTYSLSIGTEGQCGGGSSSSGLFVASDFNVINDMYDPYYNLPTQVTSRADNFQVIALETGTDIRHDINTSVAIELVDADSSASCETMTPLTDKKVWVMFNNSSTTSFRAQDIIDKVEWTNDGADYANYDKIFYQKAAKNVKFRVSYAEADTNGTINIVETPPGSGLYHLENFTAYAGDNCVTPFTGPTYHPVTGVINGDFYYQLVPTACGNSGSSSASALTEEEVRICMRCIYGNPPTSCSADSFAIRPEAFMIKVKDQNQTAPTTQVLIDDTISGVASPSGNILQMASGYNYNLEVNATNYYSNASSPNYNTAVNNAELIWEPRAGSVTTGCNDNANKNTNVSFVDGSVDTNLLNNQVGEYRLTILDDTWTDVDSNLSSASMLAHASSANFSAGRDCVINSTSVGTVASNALSGCNVSSNHNSVSASGSVYRDYNVTYHPYKFDLATAGLEMTPSVGLTNSAITSTSYVYMADMNKSKDMSYHLNGYIRASGYNDTNLSNFVGECFAKAIDINVTRTMNPVVTLPYQYRFDTLDASDVNISSTSGDLNNSAGPFSLSDSNFTALVGSINSNLNLNFFREVNATMNPQVVQFHTYRVDCSTSSDCSFNADTNGTLVSRTTNGILSLDHNITHYYGRTNGPRQRFTGYVGDAFIYYEAYCNGVDSNNIACNKAFLQDGNTSKYTNDPRWFKNTVHSVSTHGNIGSVSQKGLSSVVTPTAYDNSVTGVTKVTLMYGTIASPAPNGYPYKATMENNASAWLIYNKYDINDVNNEFEVEFGDSNSSWAGQHETDTNTRKSASDRTNRRSMW